MKIINILKKYIPLINIVIISNFANVIYVFLYLNVYFISYLYYKDIHFSYFIIKLILPLFSLGYLFGGFSIYFILNILGYVKSIFISVFIMGFIFFLQSYSTNCISYWFYAFIVGFFLSCLYVFMFNYCFNLYPNKIGIFSGLLSSGFSMTFFPINILSFYIINKNNSKPTFLVGNFLIFKESEVENLPIFFKIYGFILMVISIVFTISLKNPDGIKSYLSKYLEKIIIFREGYNSFNSKNSQYLISNNKLKSNYFDSQSYSISKDRKSFHLQEKLNSIKIEDEKIEKEIEKQIFFENLFSKKFILIFILFINNEFIYSFYSINLKIIGFKYYNEKKILKISFIIFISNIITRLLSGISLQYFTLKNNLYWFNIIYLIGISFRLFTNSDIFSFLISYIFIFTGLSLSLTCFFMCSRKIYGEGNLSVSLNGILQSCLFLGSLLEYIFEILIIYCGFIITELLVLWILILNFYIIFNIKI